MSGRSGTPPALAIVPAPAEALAVGHSAGHSAPQPRASGGRKSRTVDTASAAPAPLPQLVGLAEAARALGVKPWTVRELIWRGTLPRVRLPGVRRLLVDAADLRRLVADSKQ